MMVNGDSRMKIKPEHYDYMRRAIAALPAETIESIRRNAATDPRVRDLNMRVRWDVSYAAGLGRWLCDNVYPYADDTHVDTVLRRIVREP